MEGVQLNWTYWKWFALGAKSIPRLEADYCPYTEALYQPLIQISACFFGELFHKKNKFKLGLKQQPVERFQFLHRETRKDLR